MQKENEEKDELKSLEVQNEKNTEEIRKAINYSNNNIAELFETVEIIAHKVSSGRTEMLEAKCQEQENKIKSIKENIELILE